MNSYIDLDADVDVRSAITSSMQDHLGPDAQIIDSVDPSATGRQYGRVTVVTPDHDEWTTVRRVSEACIHATGDDDDLRRAIAGPAFLSAS